METWAITCNGEVAMSMLPKCASTSFKSAPHLFNKFVSNEEVLDIPIRIAWIRNPFDRLVSAYRKLHVLQGTNLTKRFNCTDTDVDTWEHFVDYMLTNTDPHWDPQIFQLMHKSNYVPTVSYRFETMVQNWPESKHLNFPHSNKSIPIPVLTIDYRFDELAKLYLHDINFWTEIGDNNG